MGTRTASIDQQAIRTEYGTDESGRHTSVQAQVSVDGGVLPATRYTYDEAGNKLTQTDAENRTTRWTYDLHGRITSRTLPLGQTETFSYDDVAHTQTHTDFNGDTATTQMDVMGRVTRVDYSKDGRSVSYTYWPNDLVKTVTTEQGTVSYDYDSRDRLIETTQADGTTLSYEYDLAGNRTQVQVTRGGEVTSLTDYTYDHYNRLTTVTDTQGTTVYGYDPVGNLSTVSYPNGLVTSYEYNSVNQLTAVTTRDSNNGDAIVSRYAYGLTDSGRRESITEHSGRLTQYTYDDLYRLKTETISDTTNGDYSASYTYDFVGNRTYETVQGVSTAYSYDLNDRLTQQGGNTYTHDDNGNTLTQTLDGITTTYGYDSQNRMVSANSDTLNATYRYNANGLRVGKTENGQITAYTVDENRDYGQVLEEITDGTLTVGYTYGLDLVNQTRAGEVRYYHYDGLGSTRALSDASGSLTDAYDYEAFGEALNQTGDTENRYLFTGEQFDAGLDQYYLRARYFDQGVGRFASMDSWAGNSQDPITLHKYLYANADPVMYTDPTGNFSLGSIGAGFNASVSLATAASTGYDIGTILYGHYSGTDPIEFNQVSAKQIGFSLLMSYGGAKVLKALAKSKRFKKYLKQRTLYRGVSPRHADYEDAKRGYVPGGWSGLFMSESSRESAADKHNEGIHFATPFSSWTARRGVAKGMGQSFTGDDGILITAKIMSFRIFKSPDRKASFDFERMRPTKREYEFLVVGPVQGIPTVIK